MSSFLLINHCKVILLISFFKKFYLSTGDTQCYIHGDSTSLLCYAHRKCRYGLSPHDTITMPVAVFPMLCLLFPWLTNWITGSLYLPLPITHFAPSPPSPSGNHQFVFCIYKSDSAFCSFVYSSVLFFRFHIWLKSCNICLSLTYFTRHNTL